MVMNAEGSEGTSNTKKQISILVPLEDYVLIRNEAAKKQKPMTEIVIDWINPRVQKLKERHLPKR